MTRTEPVAGDSIRSSAYSSIPCALLRRSSSHFSGRKNCFHCSFLYRWEEIENYF